MSFNNTKTPLKPTCKATCQLPKMKDPKTGAVHFYIPEEYEEKFCKMYSKHFNSYLMKYFGLSFSTLHRLAKERNLVKDMKVIRKKLAQFIKNKCEDNGYYDSLRGKPVSEQCRKASSEWRKTHHPMTNLKETNIRRYNKLCKSRSVKKKELISKERMRVRCGLSQTTKMHIPQFNYTKKQVSFRYNMMKKGYVLGDYREDFGERYIIYYDSDTTRGVIAENNASKYGFKIKPLT